MSFVLQRFPPLVLCTTSFIAGIAWHAWNYSFFLPCFFIALLACICLPYDQWYWQRFKKIFPWLAIAWLVGLARITFYDYYQTSFSALLCNKKIDVTGTIINCIKTNNKRFPMRITLAINTALETKTQRPLPLENQPLIQISFPEHHKNLELEAGDLLSINELYLRIPPTGSSYCTYLKKQGIIATGKTSSKTHISHSATAHTTWLATKRNAILAQCNKTMSPQAYALFSSIFLGQSLEHTKTNDTIREQFQWWGISHYLARSGLHLVMIVLLLNLLLMIVPLPSIIKRISIALFITLYTLLSWPSVSFVRALIMVGCYSACSFVRIHQHTLHILAIACCIILLYNPFYLFALDFQLSFILTSGLAFIRDAHQAQQAPAVQILAS